VEKPYQLVAKAIVFDEQDRVLLLHRSEAERKHKAAHGFDFPGGSLQVNETMLDGLTREVLEETGLTMQVIAPVHVYEELQAEKHLVIVKFVCIEPQGELRLSEEHDAYEWISVTTLPGSKYPDWMQEEIIQAHRIYQVAYA
jgi:8-oxo-dGTP diphosphatase